jgi:hypothetical protein
MIFKFLKIIGIGLILSVSTLANATLIDNGDYSTDTESGLDWLDWTETKNMTQIEALSQFSGAGWRAATGDEASGLMENFFLDGLAVGITGNISIPMHASLKFTFAQLLGVTNNWGNDMNTYALVGTGLYGIDDNYVFNGFSGVGTYQSRITWGGIALARATAVPEPAIITLFTLGLAGIGFARRRRF